MREHAENPAWNMAEQFGSKKGCSTQELSLNIKFVDDIMCMLHLNGSFLFNNMKNCYDHIAHPIMSLALYWLGIPKVVNLYATEDES